MLKQPWLHLASPAGIAASTSQSTHLSQGKSLSVNSGEDINLAAGRSLIGALSDKLSLFVQRRGIKLFAGQGKVEVQAQSDEMALTDWTSDPKVAAYLKRQHPVSAETVGLGR